MLQVFRQCGDAGRRPDNRKCAAWLPGLYGSRCAPGFAITRATNGARDAACGRGPVYANRDRNRVQRTHGTHSRTTSYRGIRRTGDRTRTGDVQLGNQAQAMKFPPNAPNNAHVGTRRIFCDSGWRKRRELAPPNGAYDAPHRGLDCVGQRPDTQFAPSSSSGAS